MSLRDVITIPHDTLTTKARKVKNFDDDLRQLIEDMVETMREAPGVGLAAPQVNVRQRVIVIEFGDEEDEEAPRKLFKVVNPEITRRSDETVMGVEGCLSIPELVGEVERAVSVTVKGQNPYGQPMKVKAQGWLARIFQHEIDHLDGVLFIDRAENIFRLEDLEAMSEDEPTGID